MKFRKRSLIYSLLAGLIILTNSCSPKKDQPLELLSAKILADFPSASAIEYDNGRLYIFGDDAPYLLILDSLYNKLDTVGFINDTTYRVDKEVKPDIESAAIISHNDEKHLYALGSFSTGKRMNLLYFPLADLRSFLTIDYSLLSDKLQTIAELNIEGLAFFRSKFIMANRANKTHRTNQLIITGNVMQEDKAIPPVIINLILDSNTVIGVSGLYYLENKDLLLFTASEEDTPNAIEDGTIAGSYLGWISNFSKKTEQASIRPDQLIGLSTVSKEFEKQKIESVCVERQNGNELVIHLVADNDKGQSKLFKMRLKL